MAIEGRGFEVVGGPQHLPCASLSKYGELPPVVQTQVQHSTRAKAFIDL